MLRRWKKRGFDDSIWKAIIVLIITLAMAIIFFFIIQERLGGILHL